MSDESKRRESDQIEELPPEAVSGEQAEEVTGGALNAYTPANNLNTTANPTLSNPSLNTNLNNTFNR